jgi:hypothetical protein
MRTGMKRFCLPLALSAVAFGVQQAATAQDQDKSFEVYGFAMVDYTQNFDRANPQWEDALRPSRIAVDEEQYGANGHASISAKQSRLGVRATLPTGGKALTTRFEFDMFGVGNDAGETTIRLRHAYGQWGSWLAGQTNSLFMDGDIFPNTVEYWGPNGMVFLRPPQIRWTSNDGDGNLSFAIENPGNDIDSGHFNEEPGFPGTQANEELPDITAQIRFPADWGKFQVGAIVRKISAEVIGDTLPGPGVDLGPVYESSDTGYGLDLTTVINVGERDALRAGVVYGEGIASYMNDGGMDAGPSALPGTPGVEVEAVPMTGVSLYFDHYWSSAWSTSLGYSYNEVDNTPGQTPDTYKKGQYASFNLLHYPAERILYGVEAIWGTRENLNGADGSETRLQFSFKYNFSSKDFQ